MQIENQTVMEQSEIVNLEGVLRSELNEKDNERADEVKVSLKADDNKINEREDESQRKVGTYSWKKYCPTEKREINYIGDFLKENEGAKILRKKLGLVDSNEGEKNGAKKADALTFNSSNVRLMDVAENIMNRLVNTGGLDEEKNIIKRKRHNNDNFYEQDEFIDDQPDHCRIQQYVTKYEDFFAFEGSKEDFMNSPRYHSRINEINSIVATKKIKKAIKRSKPLEKTNASRSPTKKPMLDIEEFRKSKIINCAEGPKKPAVQSALLNFFKPTPSTHPFSEKKSNSVTPMNELSQNDNITIQSPDRQSHLASPHSNKQKSLLLEAVANGPKLGEESANPSKEVKITPEKTDTELLSQLETANKI
jgi:hypothetical protein